jgi:hypothetical protein
MRRLPCRAQRKFWIHEACGRQKERASGSENGDAVLLSSVRRTLPYTNCIGKDQRG